MLYDNQQTYVPLGKETDFIRNYIELMRIRLSSNVQMTTQIDILPDSQTLIAPLIFISLIENAFKHGISPTERSFIHIHLAENETEVICEISNSNHPKNIMDKEWFGHRTGTGEPTSGDSLSQPVYLAERNLRRWQRVQIQTEYPCEGEY